MGAGGDEGTKRGAALSEEERCTQTKQSGHHHNEKERLDTAGAKGKHREGSATNTPSSPRRAACPHGTHGSCQKGEVINGSAQSAARCLPPAVCRLQPGGTRWGGMLLGAHTQPGTATSSVVARLLLQSTRCDWQPAPEPALIQSAGARGQPECTACTQAQSTQTNSLHGDREQKPPLGVSGLGSGESLCLKARSCSAARFLPPMCCLWLSAGTRATSTATSTAAIQVSEWQNSSGGAVLLPSNTSCERVCLGAAHLSHLHHSPTCCPPGAGALSSPEPQATNLISAFFSKSQV